MGIVLWDWQVVVGCQVGEWASGSMGQTRYFEY